MEKSKELLVKKNNDIDLPKIINSEVNFLNFPFFALERKNKKLETEYKKIDERGNKKIEIIWNVSTNPKYGYPGPFDREVHKAIEQIISEILKTEGKIENPISFSIYDLCNRIGITSSGGKNYRKVKESLERIRMTGIKSEGAFYHKGQKEWITKAFGLYDSIIFRGERLEDGIVSEKNLLFLGNIYLQSLNSFYIKPIDYTYLQSLKSKIASRLYEILGVKFYRIRNKKNCDIHFKYSTLCQLLPVNPYRYFSDAKRQLNSGNKELMDTGFISKFEWSENGKNDWLIYYWPGERAKKEMKNGQAKQLDFKEDDYLIDSDNNSADINIKKQPGSDHSNDLITQLVDLNVSKITAKNLVKKYNNETIKNWVRAIDFTNADDKAAYIVKAVKEGWQLPEEYLREKENNIAEEEQQKINSLQQKEQEKKQKLLQEEKQKLDQIYHSLDPDKQKEIDREAEKRLDDFWKAQLNKEKLKGKLSKILKATLKEKRREIIRDWIENNSSLK
ncbi:MAG: replication initiator protein A [Candidatus Omnitrophota bacterium]